MALSDRELIGIIFDYVDGRIFEVTAADPEIPAPIQYRDLTTGAKGVMLSKYARETKPRQHLKGMAPRGPRLPLSLNVGAAAYIGPALYS